MKVYVKSGNAEIALGSLREFKGRGWRFNSFMPASQGASRKFWPTAEEALPKQVLRRYDSYRID